MRKNFKEFATWLELQSQETIEATVSCTCILKLVRASWKLLANKTVFKKTHRVKMDYLTENYFIMWTWLYCYFKDRSNKDTLAFQISVTQISESKEQNGRVGQ